VKANQSSQLKGAPEVLCIAKGQELKALVIDDIQTNRDILSEVLRDLGIDAQVSASAKDGIALIEKIKFDIVFMDILMPEMDGIEATKEIRKNISSVELKIVAVTALGLEEKRKIALEAGCDDFLTKPFRVEKLVNTIAKLLPVEFIYSENKTSEANEKLPLDISKIKIPHELLNSLNDAVGLCSVTQIEELLIEVGNIDEEYSRLVDKFKELLGLYDVDGMVELLRQLDQANQKV
jgi:CheY-like chemotaxis protein